MAYAIDEKGKVKYFPTQTPKVTTPTKTTTTTKAATTPKAPTAPVAPVVPAPVVPAPVAPAPVVPAPLVEVQRNPVNDYYRDALDTMRRQQAAQEEALRQRTAATVASIQSNIPGIERDYAEQQRQNYIANVQAMYALPDYLKAMGISGGMSETEATRLAAGYQTAKQGSDTARNTALENIQNMVAQAQASGDVSLAEAATNYYNQYVNTLLQQAQYQADTDRWQQEFGFKQQLRQDDLAQLALDNAYRENQLALSRTPTRVYSSNYGTPTDTPTQSTAEQAPSGNYDTVLANVRRALGGSNMASESARNAVTKYLQEALMAGVITENEAKQILKSIGYEV